MFEGFHEPTRPVNIDIDRDICAEAEMQARIAARIEAVLT
jgi:hypothetical protein